jgi:hypothetical protein
MNKMGRRYVGHMQEIRKAYSVLSQNLGRRDYLENGGLGWGILLK